MEMKHSPSSLPSSVMTITAESITTNPTVLMYNCMLQRSSGQWGRWDERNGIRWLEHTKTDSVNDGLKFKFQFLRRHTGYVLAIKLLQSLTRDDFIHDWRCETAKAVQNSRQSGPS